MKYNILHINIKKCCYICFTSNSKEITADDDMLNIEYRTGPKLY